MARPVVLLVSGTSEVEIRRGSRLDHTPNPEDQAVHARCEKIFDSGWWLRTILDTFLQ